MAKSFKIWDADICIVVMVSLKWNQVNLWTTKIITRQNNHSIGLAENQITSIYKTNNIQSEKKMYIDGHPVIYTGNENKCTCESQKSTMLCGMFKQQNTKI